MADPDRRPLLNPILNLRRQPRITGVTGGGKVRDGIKLDWLEPSRERLEQSFLAMASLEDYPVHFSDRTVLHVIMDENSQAASWTPSDFFLCVEGPRFITPYSNGFLIDLPIGAFKDLARAARLAQSINEMVDISRISGVRLFDSSDVSSSKTSEEIWENSPQRDGQRMVLARLLPMKDDPAREALVGTVRELNGVAFTSLGHALIGLGDLTLFPPEELQALQRVVARGDRVTRMIRSYQETNRGTSTVLVNSPEQIDRIVASGAFFKLEAGTAISGSNERRSVEPERPPLPELVGAPIVGVVDGGRDASSYDEAEAWSATPLVPDGEADRTHGNRVTSLVVQGSDWNPDLGLFPLLCRFGTAQAVPKSGSSSCPTPEELVAYLGALMDAHPEVRVWNMSFNTHQECDPDQISYLGHLIARVCRSKGTLPVISVGNGTSGGVRPPADCEAALTVGGHLADGTECPVSRPGPGPAAVLTPLSSHVSKVRALGGKIVSGSSFSTALTSPIAAHTHMRLIDPSPDMVRALIVNRSDGVAFDPRRGFGSLATDDVPWNCSESAVSLMWEVDLNVGNNYYWELPIPQALLVNGKLSGSGALTAVLNPHPLADDLSGANYFGVRANVALQYPGKSKNENLLGSLDTDKIAENIARRDLYKWSAIRHHENTFGSKGLTVYGNKLQVHARLYARDLYAFGFEGRREDLPSFKMAFVLTLKSNGPSALYDDYRVQLGSDVEVGVIDTVIDIGNE